MFFRERLSWDRGVGIVVIIFGVCLVVCVKYVEMFDVMCCDVFLCLCGV